VKEMEARGIGRPSTYAATIRTLKDRNYVDPTSRTMIPTDIGMTVSTFLEEHFAEYISDEFTAHMEDELDLLAEGKEDYVKLLSNFYNKFTEAVASKKDVEKITNIGKVEGFDCPKCGAEMV
jgi:DNA topoisomerase-1